jgi:hypothetical protein
MSMTGGRFGLAGLFAVAHGQAVHWSDADYAQILDHQLDSRILDASPRIQDRTITYREVLNEKRPSREHLLAAKDYFKCADVGDDGIPSPVAYLLYIGTIAAGLCAGMQISSLKGSELDRAFDWAVSQQWVDHKMSALIRAASDLVKKGNV